MENSQLYRLLGALALGQFSSLLLTITGFTSTTLANLGIDAPTFQSFCNYVILCTFYGTIFISRRKQAQVRWYYYLLLALVDVEGNYFVVRAYQYTSLTSVMLLDCWAIPCVILLTWLLMKTKYSIGHYVGICTCILGLVLVILSDVHADDRAVGSSPMLGDVFVIIGSTLYAFSNVGEEFIIKKVDLVEIMTFLGLFGAIISGCQVAILEHQILSSIDWTSSAILSFVGYGIACFLFYSVAPIILKLGGAALFNLSLLTSDMWAVAIRIFAFHQVVDWLFYVAFCLVAVGLVIYSASDKNDNGVEYRKVHVSAKHEEENESPEDIFSHQDSNSLIIEGKE